MPTIALDDNHDIFIDSGSLATVSGRSEIEQSIKQSVLSLDIETYTQGNVNPEFIRAAIKSRILSTSGIISLTSFSSRNAPSACGSYVNLSIDFTAITSSGLISVSL